MNNKIVGLFFVLLYTLIASSCNFQSNEVVFTISGTVIDVNGKELPFADVGLRNSENVTKADENGNFVLDLPEIEEGEITAWVDGYYIGSETVKLPFDGILEIILRPYHQSDNVNYSWLSPFSDIDSEGACGVCHPSIIKQWQFNAHGQSTTNPRFFSMYSGFRLDGTSVKNFGYLEDFPNTTGNCAACHAPGAAVNDPFSTDMNIVKGDVLAAVHCDYCHKIGGIYLTEIELRDDNFRKLQVFENMPGVFSTKLLRPPEDDQIFFGPYKDVHDPDTYLPIIEESEFCAPCHQFKFWGTQIYDSFGEWSNSTYADEGTTCQDCHMLPNGDEFFALEEVGGLAHNPEKIPSHLQLGATDEDFLRNAIELKVDIDVLEEDKLLVSTTIFNSKAGHHYPTDHPGRHLVLVISAKDTNGRSLELIRGQVIPDYGGSYAKSPGVIYAKILQDTESGHFPVVSYWKQTTILMDNRIPALESTEKEFLFNLPEQQAVIEVKLIFRRVFEEISNEFQWDTDDILLHSSVSEVGK